MNRNQKPGGSLGGRERERDGTQHCYYPHVASGYRSMECATNTTSLYRRRLRHVQQQVSATECVRVPAVILFTNVAVETLARRDKSNPSSSLVSYLCRGIDQSSWTIVLMGPAERPLEAESPKMCLGSWRLSTRNARPVSLTLEQTVMDCRFVSSIDNAST